MRDAGERAARFVGDGLWIPAGLGRRPATFAVATLSVLALVGVFLTSARLTVISVPSAGVDALAVCAGAPAGAHGVRTVAQTDCANGPAVTPGVQVVPGSGSGTSAAGTQGTQASAGVAAMAPTCAGDGTSGNRFQFYYAYFRGQKNRVAAVRPNLIRVVDEANGIVFLSARMHAAYQSLRIVTDGNCVPTVSAIELPAADADSFSATVRDSHLRAGDRKYVLFTDSERFCGVGTMNVDDRPGPDNANNSGPSWARVDLGCWDAPATVRAIFRMLGAVQHSAPAYTASGHCAEGYDLVCQSETPGSRAAVIGGGPAGGSCADPAMVDRLDCAGDEYYNPKPAAGSYLASHWNTANSSFLYDGPAAGPGGATPPGTVVAAGQP